MISFRQHILEGPAFDAPFGKDGQDRGFRTNRNARWITTEWHVDGVTYQGEFMYQDPKDFPGVEEDLEDFWTYEFTSYGHKDHQRRATAVFNGALTALWYFCKTREPRAVKSEPSSVSRMRIYKKASANPRVVAQFASIGYEIHLGPDPDGLMFDDIFYVQRKDNVRR